MNFNLFVRRFLNFHTQNNNFSPNQTVRFEKIFDTIRPLYDPDHLENSHFPDHTIPRQKCINTYNCYCNTNCNRHLRQAMKHLLNSQSHPSFWVQEDLLLAALDFGQEWSTLNPIKIPDNYVPKKSIR